MTPKAHLRAPLKISSLIVKYLIISVYFPRGIAYLRDLTTFLVVGTGTNSLQ